MRSGGILIEINRSQKETLYRAERAMCRTEAFGWKLRFGSR
ncbi:hypothetical protein SS05631_a48380 (plasmid) [Sinorhizobium sp. CCBAU 05631]|nr:hypothetical protein SS05631_a48380 [Sinorhizobium sp. CCBAU 05631]